MKKETIDRRVRYTRTQLENAMVMLLQERHISKISVKSLCDIADINRSTFYAHYIDQYDLLEQMRRKVFENIKHYLEEYNIEGVTPVSETNLKMILEYGKSNSELFKAFLSENCDNVFQNDIMDFLQIIPPYIDAGISERTRDYVTGFILSGCISILQRWLYEGMPESTQEMTEIILRVMNHGLEKFR